MKFSEDHARLLRAKHVLGGESYHSLSLRYGIPKSTVVAICCKRQLPADDETTMRQLLEWEPHSGLRPVMPEAARLVIEQTIRYLQELL